VSTEQPQEGGHKKPPIPTPAKKVPAYNIEKRGDRLYPVESLHKWFAISSLLLFILTVGMVMQDYSRQWKRYQREFNEISVRNTRNEAIDARNSVDVARYQQLGREMREAEAALAQSGGRVTELEGQIASLTARWTRVDQDYRFTKAEFDADRYAFEEALARKAADVDSLKAKSDATEKLMDQYFLDREVVNTELQAAKDELAAMQTRITENRRQRETMRADYERLVRQFNTLNPGALVTSVINAPLMDFMRPSLQVKQILLPNLFYDQPFKQISRADRCTTCHLGIDNAKYENEAQPFKTHPNLELYLGANSPHAMEQFGCTSCHGGLDRATDFQTAGHTPRTEMQKEDWIFKYGWHYDHYLETPMLSMPNIEAGCYKCHSASPEVPRAPNLNNGRDLVRIYGCFGCHKMPGYEGIRKVGPDLSTVSGKLTKDWVKKWLANPRDFKSEARMPKFWFNTNNSGVLNGIDWDKRNIAEINAIAEFLWSKSTARTLPAKNTSGNAARGKELVEARGCFGCHAVGPIEASPNRTQTRRQHGYNLAAQGSKVTANWIANWVQDPRQVWVDSKMPSLRLTDSEVADITAYLSSLKNPQWDAKPTPQTDPAALDAVVFEFLRAGTTEAKAKTDLAAMSTEQKNLYAGERLIGRYGCYACHNVPGFERAQPIGTELTEAGSKLISQLDFGFLEIEHQRADWYTEKLKNPRVFDEGRIKRPDELLKMPNFGFREDEIRSIVMVLTSMVKDQVPLQMRDRTDPEIAEGRRLVAEKNCRGCHVIETLGGDIRAHVTDNIQWPPNLSTQGQKTQPEWLRAFLKDPGADRPRWWMEARMPTFHFTEREITVLGQYFSKLDDVDWGWIDTTIQATPEELRAGQQLFDELKCISCHPTSANVKLEEGKAPAPSLSLAAKRLRPDWIVRWLEDPITIVPDTRMPTFFAVDQATGRRKTQVPNILGGDVDAQIRAIRNHVFTLGGGSVRGN
jgi:cbb3-type cytochrome oxidase cytochrome c subunit/predicted  nucleic acid-binding Zn-ribbon protein